MNLIPSDVLGIMKEVSSTASTYSIADPYLVGGYVRNLYLESNSDNDDLDFTVNNGDESLYLGILFCKKNNLNFNIYSLSHLTTRFRGKKIDFSSGFISEGLPENTYDYAKEPLSRDFTVDSLHIKCKDLSVYDFTGRGLDDIDNKIIDTVLDPKITLLDDPKRIYRALSLSSKYNLAISDRVIDEVRSININDFIKDNYKFITSIVDDAFGASSEITRQNIENLNLYDKIPLFGAYRDYLIESGNIKKYLKGEL